MHAPGCYLYRAWFLTSFFCSQIQDERERYVARKFKYEDVRPEQIQDLEVCIIFIDVVVFFLAHNLIFSYLKHS